jgi:hypothetical protein
MKKLAGVHLAAGLALLGLAIGGCAGGGAGGPVRAGADAASGQVAAAMFVQQWAQTLWGLVSSQTGTGEPTVGPPTPNPDGSISITFTGADGTVTALTVFPDGSSRAETTFPDGSTQTASESADRDPSLQKAVNDCELASSSGLTVTYTSVWDTGDPKKFDTSDDTRELKGASVLPDGKTQDFDVLSQSGQTNVHSTQSDGSDFTLDVPLQGPDFLLPDFAPQAAGTYRSAGYDIQLTLSSTTAAPHRWARLLSDLGGGLTGEFALGRDFSGSGRLLEGGRAIALLSWTRSGETHVSFTSAGRSATSPAGAALDFLTHRWQTLAGLMAPAPGAASVQTILEGAAGR